MKTRFFLFFSLRGQDKKIRKRESTSHLLRQPEAALFILLVLQKHHVEDN